MSAYLYTSVAIELDNDWEIFFFSFELMNINRNRLSELYHTQQILRNRNTIYQPIPNDYPIAFGTTFGNQATILGGCTFTVDRFISAQGYAIHSQKVPVQDNGDTLILHYLYEYNHNANISVTEYVFYPSNGTSNMTEWYLETKELFYKNNKTQTLKENEMGQVMLKNGYIYHDVLYMSIFNQLEVYKLDYPYGSGNRSLIRIIYQKNLLSSQVLYCNNTFKNNYAKVVTISLGFLYLLMIIVLFSIIVIIRNGNHTGHKFMVNYNGEFI